MKLLIISNNLSRASFRQRIEINLAFLRNVGIEYEVASYPESNLARWKLLRKCRLFDAVFLHKRRMNFFDAIIFRKYARHIIYDFDDAVMFDDQNPERYSPKRQRSFERTVKLADIVLAGNAYLAEKALAFNCNVHVLPTGLATSDYRCETSREKDGIIRLVWIGSQSTLPYLAEIRPALEKIGEKYDNVVLRMICDNFFDLKQMKVEICPWALNTQGPDLALSDIGLAPLPNDPFTRGKCGFKILQYASAGLPVVASPIGVNADLVRDGVNGIVAGNIQQWVDAISSLIEDKQLMRKMGHNGLAMVKDYDVDAIGIRFAELIKQSISNSLS
jgi:glycosyltransferase involved in cell wall biosynthesis